MPRFSKGVEMRTFDGEQIPKSSKKSASGSSRGVYFHWKGCWNFTAINGYYIEVGKTLLDIQHKGKPVVELK